MAHIDVECLAPGDRQDNGAERHKGKPPVLGGEGERPQRREGTQYPRSLHDLKDAENRQRREPQEHHWSEQPPHPGGAGALDHEQADQNGHRQGDHPPFQGGGYDIQALDRAEDRNGGRHKCVAEEQRGTEHAEHQQRGAGVDGGVSLAQGKRHQGQDAAFAAVVSPHDEDDVLDRHHHDQGPEHERQDPEHVALGQRQANNVSETLAQGIERTGADIPVNNTERGQ
jgi:hypothetical protein